MNHKRILISIIIGFLILPILYIIKYLIETYTISEYVIHFEIVPISMILIIIIFYKVLENKIN